MEEQIFEIIEEKTCADLTEEEIQEWIDVSEKYYNQNKVVVGMDGGDCTECSEVCCEICESGHAIITGVQEKEKENHANMIGCTNEGCSGPFL